MRPHASRRLFACALLAAAFAAHAQAPAANPSSLPEPVARALAGTGIPMSAVGAFVQEIGTARPSIAFNAEQAMNPASVMKLVTTYAGLELLGPNYTWRTELLARGGASEVLGDVVLRGNGDPKLTHENMLTLLRSLRARGVREIRGDLVLDRGAFEAAETDPARFDNEPTRPYNVGPDPLLTNFKAVRFIFVPDSESRGWTVIAEPRLPQVELSANLKMTNGGCGDWRAAVKADVQNGARAARVAFNGAIPASCGERSWYFGLLSHQEFVFGLFKSLWEEQGGVLRGGWREGRAPPDARVIASIDSAPLTELIRDINKFSNNVMARQVFLTLSAEVFKLPGRTDRSARAVQTWLREKGVNLPELVIENGSGLSRIERVSPAGMGRMLLAAFRSPVMPEFISSMPIAAYDGTMRRRGRLDVMQGQAHIKGGSLNDVRSMAGYVLDRSGRRHVVAFFVNHPQAHQSLAAQDVLLKWIHARGDMSAQEAAAAPADASTQTTAAPAAAGEARPPTQ